MMVMMMMTMLKNDSFFFVNGDYDGGVDDGGSSSGFLLFCLGLLLCFYCVMMSFLRIHVFVFLKSLSYFVCFL